MKDEYEFILNSTNDGMIGIDLDSKITLFNRASELILKLKAEDVLGKSIFDIIQNTRLPYVLYSGNPELDQKQRLEDVDIIASRMPVKNKEGKIIGAIAVFRDASEITELASKLTNLDHIKSMLEAIINSTQDAISVVDENGIGILVNPAYTRLTGFSKNDIVGKKCTVDIADDEESIHLKVLNQKRPISEIKKNIGKNKRDIYINAAPIFAEGKLKGSVAVLHDLTETSKLSVQLDNAKAIIRNLEAKYTFADIKGKNIVVLNAIEKAQLAAQTPATVLIRGESGTGKELFAHAIHNSSDRKYGKFLRVNCMAINENLLESELFGYESGAFTGALKSGKKGYFEMAEGGTIFLDEIGDISLSTQVKLLRVLQEKEIVRVGGSTPIPVNVRVIAATNIDLEKAIEENKFRKDLYYRLNVIPIFTPPLRKHKDDLYEIVMSIIHKKNQAYGKAVEDIDNIALRHMIKYDWPGNIRELDNYISRAIINMKYNERIITEKHLPRLDNKKVKTDIVIEKNKNISSLEEYISEYERKYIVEVLKSNKNNKTKTAKDLNISVRNLYYKIKKYGIREVK